MFKQLKLIDYIQLIGLILVSIIIGYLYVNTQVRNQIWGMFYPMRAELAIRQMHCSAGSPSWMKEVLIYQTKYNNAPANQIAFLSKDGTVYHCENGYIGEYPLFSDPVDKNTRYRYASVTKLWTSDAILDLIKQGRLSFDTKLSAILTEIHNPKDTRINDITIGQLLLHRGGFDRYRVLGQDMFGVGEPICPNQLDKLNNITLGIPPNEKMSYSNLGYCLLGEVIARIDGRSYSDSITSKYNFKGSSLQFLENHRMPNEVEYNYSEAGLTGAGNIYTAFNYKGLASVAGLSGNAVDIVKQVGKMIKKPAPNILSLDPNIECDMSKLRDCYGYAMFPYQSSSNNPIHYYRDGTLLGVTSLVVVTEQGEVISVLSNGTSAKGQQGSDDLKMNIYQYLLENN